MQQQLQSTDLISFRDHHFILDNGAPGFGFSFAMRDITLYTKKEYASALNDEHKPYSDRIRPLQARDLTMVEAIFGKEDRSLAERQAAAIADTLGLKCLNGEYYTHEGLRSAYGILMGLERHIGRFDMFNPIADRNDEIETLQGNMVLRFFCLDNEKPVRAAKLRQKEDGYYCDSLTLIRELRAAVKAVR
jgi:hypothetical protein